MPVDTPSIAQVLRKHDSDGAGFVAVEKVRAVLADLGLAMASDADEVRRFSTDLDTDGLGIVMADVLEPALRSLVGGCKRFRSTPLLCVF